jgi:MFS family permease
MVMAAHSDRRERRPAATLLLYTFAGGGGVMAYLPLLTMLLPIKVEAVVGAGRFGVLAACAVSGAVAAGGANIAFGWLGDRSVRRGHGRRGLLAAGIVATIASYAGIAAAGSAPSIVVAIVLFQVAVNAMLAQIGALMAEEVPDACKGVATGWQTLGAPIASGVAALLVGAAWSEPARLAIVVTLAGAGVLPLLLARPEPIAFPALSPVAGRRKRRDLAIAWAARLLVQIAGGGVALYLLYYFEAVAGNDPGTPAAVARLFLVGAIIPVPLAILLGRWSDRMGRRKPFLLAAATVAAAGLIAMALADGWTLAALGYGAFASGSTIFLALNTGFAMQLLPDPARRGRDLGLLNLANTIPSMIAPLLTWWLATSSDFAATMLVLAALTVTAGLLTLAIRGSG